MRSSVLFLCLALVLSGCAHKQPDLTFREMGESDCYFNRKKVDLSPRDLVNQYLARDAKGEFTLTSAFLIRPLSARVAKKAPVHLRREKFQNHGS